MCRRNAIVLLVLRQVCVARHSARGLGDDLGAGSLKGHRGLHILGLDAGPCIIELVVFCITSSIFELRTLHV
jgi:hypothetical protein